MTYFVGIVDGAKNIWGVRFPDCPGAYGGGASMDEAIADATSALATWAEATLRDGDALPSPRSLAEITSDAADAPDQRIGEVAVLVPLLLDKGRLAKATLSIDAGMLEAIDAEARRRGLTRSGFLISAARDKIKAAG